MANVPPLSALEDGLAGARRTAAGTPAELSALVELAARMVRDPQRRGDLAREGLALATRLGDEVARVRCEAMVAEYESRRGTPADALPGALTTLAEAERLGDRQALAQIHHTLANCFDNLDCTAEALEHADQALA